MRKRQQPQLKYRILNILRSRTSKAERLSDKMEELSLILQRSPSSLYRWFNTPAHSKFEIPGLFLIAEWLELPVRELYFIPPPIVSKSARQQAQLKSLAERHGLDADRRRD